VRAQFCKKKLNGHKLCVSRVSIGFSCAVSKIENTGHSRCIWPWKIVRAWFRKKTLRSIILHEVTHRVEFRSIFRASSLIFKILAIPDVLTQEIQNTGHSQRFNPWELVRTQFHKKM
ncbi:hypothetical protein B296_00037072, partial [Ensete ventricosum]